LTQADGKPLIVDLDGTLIRTDLLYESLVRVITQEPWLLLWVPFWFLLGKHKLKEELARRSDINVGLLPYNAAVLEYLQWEKARGRRLVLCTGSNVKYADQIAAHLGLFSEVLASDSNRNITGSYKATLLTEIHGSKEFDYVGNEVKDLSVWQVSDKAVVVADSERFVDRVRGIATVEKEIYSPAPQLKDYFKAIRVHQWMKNLLVFVPLVTAHEVFHLQLVLQSLMAFVAFGLCASGTYIINDLLDLDSDRAHPSKSQRAFAAGTISIRTGLLAAAGLLATSGLLLNYMSGYFAATLLVYLVLTLAYSFRLKRLQTVDIITLAGLYTIRVIAGAAAIGVPLSFWLLSFSMFLFLCLAIVKRWSELIEMRNQNIEKVAGRGYSVPDIPVLANLACTSGLMSVLVLALYVNSTEVTRLYSYPELLWLICPVMAFWVVRVLITTSRGQMHEDPVIFAIKDKNSWLTGLVLGIILALAAYI
jgi:4-hydroxybenzoate polyprenyltransferase/phosphoserine phosphatase